MKSITNLIFSLFFTILSTTVANANSSSTYGSYNTQRKQNIFLSYENIPKKIFVGQKFSIKVKSIISIQNFDFTKDNIASKNSGMEILNINQKWTKKSDGIYYKTFIMRAKKQNALMPKMYFNVYRNKKLIASQKFPDLQLNIIHLNTNKFYSHVIADSLDILKVKTTKFDENNLMVVLEISAKNANLKDFKLSWVTRDGIDSSSGKAPFSKIYYYAIIPKSTNKFTFNYFNIKQNRFITKSTNLVLNDEEISTQSDLNPQNSPFILYKNIAYGFSAVILLFIYFKRRRIIYMLLFVLMAVLLFKNLNPLSNIMINKNTKIHILPTKNSTVFYITNKDISVQKLNKRKNYIKIILPNGKIGWIKEKNVINN